MRQSNIHYGPRGYEQRRNEVDRSPFPSRTTRTTTQNQQNIPFYGSQNLNNSFISNATKSPLAASQVDNIPKTYTGNFNQYNSVSDFSTPMNKQNNMNYFVSQPMMQDKSNDKIKDLVQKIQKLTNRVTKNSERINYIQREFQCKKMLSTTISEEDITKIKRQIMEELETSQQLSQDKSLSFDSLQELKKEVKDFNLNLFKNSLGQHKTAIVGALRDINSKEDQMFRQALQQKFDFETKIFKETIKGQLDVLSKSMKQQIADKIQTALLVIKDQLNSIKNQNTISGNQLTRGKYQYPFRPLLLKYQGFITLIEAQQSLKSSKQSQSEMDSQQMLYYIDPQGYLLDNERYYIVDHKGQRIRLPQKQINILTNLTSKLCKNRTKID